jgi:phosphoribosylformylglycinamidine cyclo-ligase
VTDDEMYRTFNMGLGLVLAVAPDKAAAVKKALAPCYDVGRVEKGTRVVRYR